MSSSHIAGSSAEVKSRFVEMFGENSWQTETLQNVADVQGGLTKNKRRESLELQLPYLRVANVLQGGLDLSEMLSIGLTEAERDKTLLQAGDMLFVEGNGSRDQIGRSAIWDGSINPCVHQNHLIRARLSERVLPVFALAYFSSPAGREQIVAKAVSTSGLFTLSTGKIKALEIPVPPLSLQQEFAGLVRQVDKLKFEELCKAFLVPVNTQRRACILVSKMIHNECDLVTEATPVRRSIWWLSS